MTTTAVLIPSCDQFSDVWDAALKCLNKFWPDCPWPIYTLSNHKPWGKNPITVGADQGWTGNLRTALDRIDAEFVLMYLDDMLLVREVNTAACKLSEMYMYTYPDLAAIRLGQGGEILNGGFFNPVLDIFLTPVAGRSPYRISTSPTLWRVSYLKEILQHCNSTALEFEHDGTEYSRRVSGAIAVTHKDETKRPFRVYYTAITRGQWDRRAVEWLKRDVGIEVDTTRGFMP